MSKRRKNFQRDQERLQAFLQTKCLICYTPGPIPSRRLPCCKIFLHESCLLKCFQHASTSKRKCPHCRQEIYPVNKGEPEPTGIPEGAHLLRLEFEVFAAKSPEQIADELWDRVPELIPPSGWSTYRRMGRR
jgi:predicted metal-dependent hydrolase